MKTPIDERVTAEIKEITKEFAEYMLHMKLSLSSKAADRRVGILADGAEVLVRGAYEAGYNRAMELTVDVIVGEEKV